MMFGSITGLEFWNEVEEHALTSAKREQLRKDKERNAQALQLIQQWVDQTVFQTIMITTLAKTVWETFEATINIWPKAIWLS